MEKCGITIAFLEASPFHSIALVVCDSHTLFMISVSVYVLHDPHVDEPQTWYVQ